MINALGDSFQLASAAGGSAIDITDAGQGKIYIGNLPPFADMWHDPDVIDWETYARENIAQARLYGVPVIAYLSPSIAGTSQEFLEKAFFRHQLDLMAELADGIVIYHYGATAAARDPANQGWWQALREFVDTLRADGAPSTTFQVRLSR